MPDDKINTAAQDFYLLSGDDIDASIDIIYYGAAERIQCPNIKPFMIKLANYIATQAYGGVLPSPLLPMEQRIGIQKYENLALKIFPLASLSQATFEEETE